MHRKLQDSFYDNAGPPFARSCIPISRNTLSNGLYIECFIGMHGRTIPPTACKNPLLVHI